MNRLGDSSSINETFIINETVISGITGVDIFVSGGTYDNSIGTATFINTTGGTFTVTGFTTGGTISTATTPTISACTAVYTNAIISCSGDSVILLTSGQTIFNTTIAPAIDAAIDVGTTFKRFRAINTVSGTSTVWTSTTSVTTPNLILGLDSNGNTRTITADNSIIQDDMLNNGGY